MPEKQPDSVDHAETETPPSNESSPSGPPAESAYSIGSTYRAFRETIVEIEPGGRLLWDLFRSITAVVVIVGLLVFLTGLTTPLVAVMSGSMEPNIDTGDGVIVTKYQPTDAPPLAKHPGIITFKESREQSGSHTSFGREGDVIVFKPVDGGTPIIHRAHFYVENGENWVDDADPALLGSANSCDDLANCPAPNSGFITNGDNNDVYDQVKPQHHPVSKDRVIGVGQYRIRYIGWIPNGIDRITP